MGRLGSRKAQKKGRPRWLKLKKQEVNDLIVSLAKKMYSSAMIGTILRDRYGIPSVKLVIGKSISEIMKKHKLYPELPEDLLALLTKAVRIREHLETHKKDKHSRRGLELIESRIRMLAKYYIRKGILPKGWSYSPEEAKLIVKKW
jgi:small subunit ribosomal protein S15